jgi:predicted glycosyltransferase
VANGIYATESGDASFEEVIERRSELIAATLREFDPDLVLVDRYPRGMRDELARGLAEHALRRPEAPVVLGLRDILDTPSAILEEWQDQRYSDTIARHYESILCYGDPAVFDPVAEYCLPPQVARRIRFTGYLVDELLAAEATKVRSRHAGAGQRLAVCTLGGGRDAAHIADAFLSSMERLHGREWAGVLIAGPYMKPADLERLRGRRAAEWVPVLRMVEDVPSYLAAADAAVCMGGYNTTCELLALAVPAVIIPRTEPRLEQLMRARRLAARGLLSWLHPTDLSPGRLADALEAATRRSRSELVQLIGGIDHRGIRTAVAHLTHRLPSTQPAAAARRLPLAQGQMLADAL